MLLSCCTSLRIREVLLPAVKLKVLSDFSDVLKPKETVKTQNPKLTIFALVAQTGI